MRRLPCANVAPAMLRSRRRRDTLGQLFFFASALPGLVPPAQLIEKPGPCEGPVAVRGAAGQAQGGGGLVQSQTGEETEFHQLGAEGILPGQLLEGLVEGGEVVGGVRDQEVDL